MSCQEHNRSEQSSICTNNIFQKYERSAKRKIVSKASGQMDGKLLVLSVHIGPRVSFNVSLRIFICDPYIT